ncbi:hypothetical protein D9M68_817730 [compost metagenome]
MLAGTSSTARSLREPLTTTSGNTTAAGAWGLASTLTVPCAQTAGPPNSAQHARKTGVSARAERVGVAAADTRLGLDRSGDGDGDCRLAAGKLK